MFDFNDQKPFTERVKLEGDEYDTGKKSTNKKDSAAGATLEIYRSLHSLDVQFKEVLKKTIDDSLLSGTLLGYPIVNARVRVLDGRWSNLRTKSALVIQQCTTQLMR